MYFFNSVKLHRSKEKFPTTVKTATLSLRNQNDFGTRFVHWFDGLKCCFASKIHCLRLILSLKFVTRSAGAFVDTTTPIRLRNVGRSVCLDRVVYSLHSQEVVAKPLLQSAPPRGGTRDDFSKVAHCLGCRKGHNLCCAR